MLIERLTSDEIQMITDYRALYVYSQDANENGCFADTPYVLREWEEQKFEFLYKLMGEELIIRKHFNYTKSQEELEEEISDFTSRRYGRVERSGELFCRKYFDIVFNNSASKGPILTNAQKDGMSRLMSDECLIENRYDGDLFEVDTPNGKKYRVTPGCKTSKALGKLASIFDIPGYEDFRICHSQVLNQKTLGGTLTLSIHPLDYMTMSDNDCDWDSCMSWRNEGSYRMGTVEMMNSPCVVVAYLTAEDPMPMYSSYGQKNKLYWNNKKWRQLFYVDHNIIASVKDYPYHNDDLSKMVLEWIRELAEKNCGWTYGETIEHDFSSSHAITVPYFSEDKSTVYLDIWTGAMYNDFGCLDHHWIAISDDLELEDLKVNDWNDRTCLVMKYSGKSECMICGELNCDTEDESCLACYNCQNRSRCDCCDEVSNDLQEIDGMQLCSYCYETRVHECLGCGDWHYDENMEQIFVIPRLSAEEQKELKQEYIRRNSIVFNNPRADYKDDDEWNYYQNDTPFWVCNQDDCLEKWVKEYLNPSCRPHMREMRWSQNYYVFFDELKEEWRNVFFDANSNAEYKKDFSWHQIYPTRVIEEN